MLLDMCGKPLIARTVEQAHKATLLDDVFVATDSQEIKKAVLEYGGKVVDTSDKPQTGSDRVAEAAAKVQGGADIVINIQGDEPLMPPEAIDHVTDLLLSDEKADMSTVATPFTDDTDIDEPGLVKVVLDIFGYALYFSRSRIPYERSTYSNYYNHLGIYGYRYDFLMKYTKLEQTPLEQAELLEQLRALENGYRIKVGIGAYERAEVNEQHEFERAVTILEDKIKNNER
jgi:3-deoxy-manno-octulosonate cytidylyltransferase (CMP-KDO synthetase)